MKALKPYLLLLVGLVRTTLCWMDLLYRFGLYRHYGSKPFVNHVADGYFGMMYFGSAMAAVVLFSGLVFSLRVKLPSRITLYAVASLLPLAHMVTLFFLNQQDMLVTYSEFAKNMGP